MLKHIVMFKLKEENFNANILELKDKLDQLKNKIPQLENLETGINTSKSPSAFDLILVTVFKDEKALNAYREHPDHQDVLSLVKDITEQVKVVDYYL